MTTDGPVEAFYDDKDGVVRFPGGELWPGDKYTGGLEGDLHEVAAISLSSICRAATEADDAGAFRLASVGDGGGVSLWLAPGGQLDNPRIKHRVHLRALKDKLAIEVQVPVPFEDRTPEDVATLDALIALARRRGFDVDLVEDPYQSPYELFTKLVATVPADPSRTLGEACDLERDLLGLLEALDGGPESPRSIRNLIESSRGEILVGLRETEQFDAKSEITALARDADKAEFLKDVTAMANVPGGGVLVYGLTTSAASGADEVVSAPGCDLTTFDALRWQHVITDRTVPSLVGVELITDELRPGWGFLALYVPPSVAELGGGWYLVRSKGEAVRAYRRASAQTIPVSAGVIHARLQRGDGSRRTLLPPGGG